MRPITPVRVLLLFVTLGCATAPAPAKSAAPAAAAPASRANDAADPDRHYYREMRAILDRQDLPAAKAVDWRRFRRGSMLEGNVGRHGLDASLGKSLETNDDAKILVACREALKQDAAYLRAHVVANNVLAKQGKVAESELHGAFIKGMLDSIAASGDGKSLETAFVVFHVREEYDIARVAGLKVVGQSLRDRDGRVYDVLTVRRGDGPSAKTRDLFFEITEVFAREGLDFP